MTDQMDHRLEELVTKLAASAPEAPPFPQVADRSIARTRRAPAWVLATAGAALVLAIIGLPFLFFGGGSTDEDVAPTVPTTPATVAPPPTTTPPTPVLAACGPTALRVTPLQGDGAAGHVVTPLRFTNASASPCTLEDPVAVTGIGPGGEEVAATLGTYIPIGGLSDPLVKAGDSRTMLVETGTGCEGGFPIGPVAEAVRITFPGGEVEVAFSGDLGCNFAYSAFGEWLEAAPTTDDEQVLADALIAFAESPSEATFTGLPFEDTVILTLGSQIARSQSADSLADPASWVFGPEYDGFRAYVGPFSALDLLARGRPIQATAGPHDHCASPPVPTYEDLEGLRQISIQPTDATSCLEWWTVDLFLSGSANRIAGVTLDLYEP